MATKNLFVLAATSLILAGAAMADAQTWGRRPTPRDGACFYQTADYRDDYFCLSAGEDLATLPPGVADNISSIRIFGRTEVTVFGDPRFSGRSEQYTQSVNNLRQDDFNNQISSIRVRGRGGFGSSSSGSGSGSGSGWSSVGGGNSSYGGSNPDVIVRRAYEDVLDREPDATGLRIYRSHILDDGWTEAQVRDALRKSPEYREQNTMTREKAENIVRRAYLDVLRREPDPGARPMVDRVLRDKWTLADVERELRKSPEYRNR
jgi:hypothetical protein